MIATWASEEMASVDLRDKRLNHRLMQVLSDLGQRPQASIPAACGGRAEMIAAYRLFDNDKVTYDKVMQPHYDATRKRLAAQKVVLLVQDTTELDVTRPEQQVVGAGPMDSLARLGFFMHRLETFTPDGLPLGAVWSDVWARKEEEFSLSPQEKRKLRKAAPIEEKESFRWLAGLRKAREVAEELPEVQCICVADSEADIYHLFAEPRGEAGIHWLIRACQERCVEDEGEDAGATIREELLTHRVLFRKKITLRSRKAKTACEDRPRRNTQKGRKAKMEVRAARVTLRPPAQSDRPLPPVTINVVLVRESNPPEGEEAVEWILLTTLPIDTAEQVREIVQYYCVRWMIEILFRTLKSGCRVEERLFEHSERLLPCIAVYTIIAWRTLMLVRLGRSCPDLDCEAVFEPSEWKSVWMVTHRKKPPSKPPRLAEMLRLIGQLGGYVNRPKRKDPPGPQTTWLGLQRMYDLAWAWDTFGPGAKNGP
jgi:hypothetical protein